MTDYIPMEIASALYWEHRCTECGSMGATLIRLDAAREKHWFHPECYRLLSAWVRGLKVPPIGQIVEHAGVEDALVQKRIGDEQFVLWWSAAGERWREEDTWSEL